MDCNSLRLELTFLFNGTPSQKRFSAVMKLLKILLMDSVKSVSRISSDAVISCVNSPLEKCINKVKIQIIQPFPVNGPVNGEWTRIFLIFLCSRPMENGLSVKFGNLSPLTGLLTGNATFQDEHEHYSKRKHLRQCNLRDILTGLRPPSWVKSLLRLLVNARIQLQFTT